MKDKNSSEKPKMQWWKIAALALGVVLIVTATGYSLISKANAASNGLLDKGTVPQLATPLLPADTSIPAKIPLASFTWVKNLNIQAAAANSDVAFVIFPEEDDIDTATNIQVADAVEKIQSQGVRVYRMTLSPKDPEFLATTQALGMPLLPAVLVAYKNGQSSLVFGNLNETKLLEAYLTVSKPTCAPGSPSGCCPQ